MLIFNVSMFPVLASQESLKYLNLPSSIIPRIEDIPTHYITIIYLFFTYYSNKTLFPMSTLNPSLYNNRPKIDISGNIYRDYKHKWLFMAFPPSSSSIVDHRGSGQQSCDSNVWRRHGYVHCRNATNLNGRAAGDAPSHELHIM